MTEKMPWWKLLLALLSLLEHCAGFTKSLPPSPHQDTSHQRFHVIVAVLCVLDACGYKRAAVQPGLTITSHAKALCTTILFDVQIHQQRRACSLSLCKYRRICIAQHISDLGPQIRHGCFASNRSDLRGIAQQRMSLSCRFGT